MRHHRFAFSAVLLVAVVCWAQDVIPWQDAAKYCGRTKTVEDTVVATLNTGKICLPNFSPNWKTDSNPTIAAAAFDKFPPSPETHYKCKKVRMTGRIQEYQGKARIILRRPSQIVIVGGERIRAEEAPEAASALPAYGASRIEAQAFYARHLILSGPEKGPARRPTAVGSRVLTLDEAAYPTHPLKLVGEC